MLKFKRLISAVLCAVMTFALVPAFSVSATDPVVFFADDTEVEIGSQITITIKAKNVPEGGISSALIGVRFDKSLTFERSQSFIDPSLHGQKTVGTKNIDRGDVYERRFMWVDDGEGVTGDFTFATAVFTVPEDVAPDTVFDFELAISSDPKNYLNKASQTVAVSSENCRVTISDPSAGLTLSASDTVTYTQTAEMPVTIGGVRSAPGGLFEANYTLSWDGAAALSSVSADKGEARIAENSAGFVSVNWSCGDAVSGGQIRFVCRFDVSLCSDGEEILITPGVPDGVAAAVCGEGEAELTVASTGRLTVWAHSMKFVAVAPATCEENGNIRHYVCENCKRLFTDYAGKNELSPADVTIPATGHSWGEWTVSVAAGCESAGEEKRVCANDPDHTETRTVDPLGHSTVFVSALAPDCELEGNTEHYKCGVCGALFADAEATEPLLQEYVIIPATGHDWGEWETVTPAGYDTNGEERRVCANDPTHVETRPIPALVHDVYFVGKTDPTCEQDGNKAHWLCRVCGLAFADEDATILIDDVTIPALGHAWGEWETVSEASCETAGSMRRVCANDPAHVEDSEIPATGHFLVHFAAVTPTPAADGNIEYWKCSVCEKCFADGGALNALGAEEISVPFIPEPGDVNRDGVVNARDVQLVLRYLTGWTVEDHPALAGFDAALADMNGDGRVNALDVFKTMKKIAAEEGGVLSVRALASGAESFAGDDYEGPAVDLNEDTEGDEAQDLAGDVNGDGKVNAKDVTALMKALVSPDSPPKNYRSEKADVNGDGKINAKDVTSLMKRIVNGGKTNHSLDTVNKSEFPESYNEFLSGALFCGDSICEAMMLYGYLPEHNVVAANGAGAWNIRSGQFTYKIDGEEFGFDDAVKALSPKRVVLWLGLNDTPASIENFKRNYTALVDAVKKAASEAELYFMSIAPIGGKVEFYDVTNDTIDTFNETIAQIADDYVARFVDVSSVLKGEDNCLAEEYASYDGIHLPYSAFPLVMKTFLDAVVGE